MELSGLTVELVLSWLVAELALAAALQPDHGVNQRPPFWGSHTVYGNYSGDILLGALFPVHQMGPSDADCGRIQGEDGVQPLEAMLFTLDTINNSPQMLNGVRLGAVVLDSCDSDSVALQRSMEFVKGFFSRANRHHRVDFVCGDGQPPAYRNNSYDRMVGVIGGQSSAVSIQVANLLRNFEVPQISYLSTSTTLNGPKYSYFFRTVPSDVNQAAAILEILKVFGWTHASVVYSNSDYGNRGFQKLEELASSYGICFSSPLRLDQERQDYDDVIESLVNKTNARAVVVFADKMATGSLMHAAKARNNTAGLVWIGSDAWSSRETVVNGVEDVIEGTISVQPLVQHLNGFDAHMDSLDPRSATSLERNPWLAEFWEETFGCHLSAEPADGDTRPECDPDVRLSVGGGYRQQTYLHFVRDATWAFATALDDMHRDLCGGRPGLCHQMGHIEGRDLRRYLSNVVFKDQNSQSFRFMNGSGEGPPRYSILNFQRDDLTGRYSWKTVGQYSLKEDGKANLELRRNETRFKARSNYTFPLSSCSAPCQINQVKVKKENDLCCWTCRTCGHYQRVVDEYDCQECPPGSLPSPSKRDCVMVPLQHVDYSSPWALAAIAFAVFGIVITVLCGLIFAVHGSTPVIKASGRELSYLLLLGDLLSFSLTFVIVARPSELSCGLTRFFLGLCYTVCYAAIVTKTNRISRIFTGRPRKPRTRYTSPRSQLVITALITLLEVLVNAAWLLYRPPLTLVVTPTREQRVLICDGLDDSSYLIGLIYPLILIGFCTVYAVKTRKCPGGFNEARYIVFTNYTTCVLWLAFVPLYIAASDHALRTVTLAMSLSLSGLVQLACLFFPKMYVVLWKPEKNTRDAVMAHRNTTFVTMACHAAPVVLINGSGGTRGRRQAPLCCHRHPASSCGSDGPALAPTVSSVSGNSPARVTSVTALRPDFSRWENITALRGGVIVRESALGSAGFLRRRKHSV
ncbi:metabotropic glutamate receptor 3-like [Amphibalanus amphitrite]|uniref:metabotropic glutamate receptor 3-like n=1 Tax=Amphibalanus amphitrite TaxID=1232801 RepID=UPI001C908981|nr:metabotropic glutamate receptor 3-like [Amphibalanus amphitrite]